ncbi:unnamed protein product [Pleuronectes platessa]|uniref:Uncharacterized protein n=1 Tax=Pleuronectes platessa TaxID=8262 RepID=A0A9N7TSJ0_PLEPL|nr:unnamed protein product [Pleuronectes platessa]
MSLSPTQPLGMSYRKVGAAGRVDIIISQYCYTMPPPSLQPLTPCSPLRLPLPSERRPDKTGMTTQQHNVCSFLMQQETSQRLEERSTEERDSKGQPTHSGSRLYPSHDTQLQSVSKTASEAESIEEEDNKRTAGEQKLRESESMKKGRNVFI